VGGDKRAVIKAKEGESTDREMPTAWIYGPRRMFARIKRMMEYGAVLGNMVTDFIQTILLLPEYPNHQPYCLILDHIAKLEDHRADTRVKGNVLCVYL